MRTVTGNDPVTAIQQLRPSPNILSITSLSKSHKRQHMGRSWKKKKSLKIDEREKEIPVRSRKGREVKTYLKPSWCGWWHATISFSLTQTEVSSPSHRTSIHYHPAFHQVANSLCFPSSLSLQPLVFTTLPPSTSLPHAGFLFPLIFSSTSSLALSALLRSTYNISLFLHLSLLLLSFVLVSCPFPCNPSCVHFSLHPECHFFFVLLLTLSLSTQKCSPSTKTLTHSP